MNEANVSTCGCRVDIQIRGEVIGTVAMYTGGEPPHIHYCPTHAAAPEMKEALEMVMDPNGHFYDCLPGKRGATPSDADCSRVCVKIRAALRKATLGALALVLLAGGAA